MGKHQLLHAMSRALYFSQCAQQIRKMEDLAERMRAKNLDVIYACLQVLRTIFTQWAGGEHGAMIYVSQLFKMMNEDEISVLRSISEDENDGGEDNSRHNELVKLWAEEASCSNADAFLSCLAILTETIKDAVNHTRRDSAPSNQDKQVN